MKNNKLSKNNGLIAMISAIAGGLLIHMFGLVNILHNYDSIAVAPDGYGTGITSGRWLLTFLGNWNSKLTGGFNLAWFDGILGILLLSVSAYFLIKIFNIKSPVFSALLAIGFVSFPAVSSCMLFRYTLSYYALAVLMAVLAAYFVIKGNKKYIVLWVILSGFLSACALGIYQSYLPLTASVFVLYLIQQTIQDKNNWKQILKQGLIYLLCLILGVVFYFLILKLALIYYGAELSNYQGINTMGKLSLKDLPRLLLSSFTTFFIMPIKNTYKLVPTRVMVIIYLLWDIAFAFFIVYNLAKRKARPMQWIMVGILCIFFPIAVNLIMIMCANSWVYTLMVYSYVMVLFMPVVGFEALPEPEEKFKKFHRNVSISLAVLLGLAVFAYAYGANVTYTAQYYADRHVENLANSIMTQARSTENYRSDLPWTFIGSYDDPNLADFSEGRAVYQGEGSTQSMVSTYSWQFWFKVYLGNRLSLVDDEARDALLEREEVAEMPCWPDHGSIQIIDDIVVVKFS